METSVSDRQQKTDANYLPMAAEEQNILWHLLCLSRAAVDVRETQTIKITSQQALKGDLVWPGIWDPLLHSDEGRMTHSCQFINSMDKYVTPV